MKGMLKWIAIVAVVLVLALVLIKVTGVFPVSNPAECGEEDQPTVETVDIEGDTDRQQIHDLLNGRNPEELTWEEYMQLTEAQQAVFPDYFESMDAFNSWYQAASTAGIEDIPLEDDYLNGRDPASFTWEEFILLTPAQQAQFPDLFESLDAYNAWYQSVTANAGEKVEDAVVEFDFLNGKNPADFTWEDYQNLTADQQAQLPDCFESLDAYEAWYNSVCPQETTAVDQPALEDDFLNGKNPADFTWEDYQKLTPAQQAQFPDFFESYDAFLRWRDQVKP